MNEKRLFTWLLGIGTLAAAGIGVLVHFEYEAIDVSRAAVAELKTGIDASRKILTGTGALEREVIVLRETDEVIKEILPDEQDVNNLVRDLSHFQDEAGVKITGLKKKAAENQRKEKTDFDKVGYQLNLEADAFQLLSFLDKLESHSRFMRVPDFKLNAAPRRQVMDTGVPRHKVTLDVETYVYKPQSGPAPVKIDGYTRKRELLLGEINRRRQALQVASYIYRGQRGRRDPWVDPRVPAHSEQESPLSVDEQIRIVDDLVNRTQHVLVLWGDVQTAPSLIAEMTVRAELEEALAQLEEDVRRIQTEGHIRYVPSDRRMTHEVVKPIADLRQTMADANPNQGPSKESLKELVDTMRGHIQQSEFKAAQIAFDTVEARLSLAEQDPLREPYVAELKRLDAQAKDLDDFGKIKMEFGGIAAGEGRPPVILINGATLSEGDQLGNDLIIRSIKPGVIEFLFRGMVLERRF
jgi:Tfp pilus assembly protein PilO